MEEAALQTALDNPEFFTTAEGVKLAYSLINSGKGEGQPTTIVFFHGVAGSRYSWIPYARRLAMSPNLRIILADARGHGQSDRVDPMKYTMADFVTDAIQLVEFVTGSSSKNNHPAVLVGHSLGAVQSYLVASARPDLVKSLLLEDPPIYMLKKEVFDASIYHAAFVWLQNDISAFQASGKSAAEITAELSQRPVPGSSTLRASDVYSMDSLIGTGQAYKHTDVHVWDAAWRGEVANYDEDATTDVKGILLQADTSLGPAFYPGHVKRFRKAAPNIEIVEIKGAGHAIHDMAANVDPFAGFIDKALEL